jgi:hypothetical protein
MPKPKLHEILAVEGDLDATAKKMIDEAVTTFSKKPDHFQEALRELHMFDDGRQDENTSESKAMVTTVGDKLAYVRRHIIKYYDTFAKKEATNQVAVADVVVDGTALLTGIPATLLLGLESKLKALRVMYEAIPTLQPGIDWEADSTRPDGVYRGKIPEERMRTEKVIQHKVLYEATKEHPAQIEKWSADVAIGRITVKHWSGMISPAQKSELLGRIDTLARAVKKARQRANSTEIVDMSIGSAVFDFIHQ